MALWGVHTAALITGIPVHELLANKCSNQLCFSRCHSMICHGYILEKLIFKVYSLKFTPISQIMVKNSYASFRDQCQHHRAVEHGQTMKPDLSGQTLAPPECFVTKRKLLHLFLLIVFILERIVLSPWVIMKAM